jgi:MFS family permease
MVVVIAAIELLGGFLSDRFGVRIIASVGMVIQVVALFLPSALTTSTTLLELGIVEGLCGLGSGPFWPANTSAIMSSSPRVGKASRQGLSTLSATQEW